MKPLFGQAILALFLVACTSTTKPAEQTPAARQATFDVTHQIAVPIPAGAQSVRVWMTEPQEDHAQSVRAFKVDSNGGRYRTTKDSEGNRYLYWEMTDPQVAELKVTNTFEITRMEVRADLDPAKTRPLTAADRQKMARDLASTQYAVINDDIRALSAKIVGGETNPVKASRRIYDWVLENIEYWVKDPDHLKASPVGSTEYCLETRTGNCTDFHSLYLSLSRAAGIPTRITYGSLFKAPLDGQDQDQSYHCWIEFWAPNLGWIPLDVAVADIYAGGVALNGKNQPKMALTTATGYEGPDPKMVEYYFGNLEERRVVWSRGRDLELNPHQAGGPVNAIPKAYVEIDGKPADYTRKLTYRQEQ